MINPTEFDDIRPYAPEELPVIFEELIADAEFKEVMTRVFPQLSYEQICGVIRGCKTNLEFQLAVVKPFLYGLLDKLSKGIELTYDDGAQLEDALSILEENIAVINAERIDHRSDVSKVSIVGAGMESHPGIASKMFEALYDSGINIDMISTSEIKISVLIDAKYADKAVSVVHDAFFA